MHCYADANYGDDSQAIASNPNSSELFADVPGGATGQLQHAPFSFRTITAAINWAANTVPANYGVVVHILPGLYGPAAANPVDPDCGLAWNGEPFPLRLPPNVSLQGTSALDTILDAKHATTTVVDVGGTNQGWGGFIDSLTIRGARGVFTWGVPIGSRPGAGVFIEGTTNCGGAISNCIFHDNTVGIALIGEVFVEGQLVVVQSAHTTSILFNTVAYNEVGVYSGTNQPAAGWTGTAYSLGKGVSSPALMNNVLESTTPQSEFARGTIAGASAFEGLGWPDMSIAGLPITTRNSNAFDVTGTAGLFRHSNNFVGAPISWSPTQFGNSGKPSTPRVDLVPWSNAPAARGPAVIANRGVIYINDAFRDAGLARSFHDFRIAPMGRQFASGTFTANPLIGVASMITRGSSITMANGTVVNPGWVNAEQKAYLDALDWDCDGFGNPRIGRKGYDPVAGTMPDIGADEANSLIISGYLDDTRMFSTDHAAIAGHMPVGFALPARTSMFFFDFFDPQAKGSAQSYLRPWFNLMPDFAPGVSFQGLLDNSKVQRQHPTAVPPRTLAPGDTQWYQQLHVNPYLRPGSTSNYTDGGITDAAAAEARLDRVTDHYATTPKGYPEFMRNLNCDVAPHLFPSIPNSFYFGDKMSDFAGWMWVYDGTPAWGTAQNMRFSSFQGAPHDWELTNPWFKGQDFTGAGGVLKNWSNSALEFVSGGSVEIGLPSPPGTCPAGLFNYSGAFPWLTSRLYDHIASPGFDWRINPWDFNTDGVTLGIYQVATNGIGDAFGIDVAPFVPGSDWHGLRVNLEQPWPGHSDYLQLGDPTLNIQTVLIVQGPPGTEILPGIDPGAQSQGGGLSNSSSSTGGSGSGTKTPRERVDDFRELIRNWILN